MLIGIVFFERLCLVNYLSRAKITQSKSLLLLNIVIMKSFNLKLLSNKNLKFPPKKIVIQLKKLTTTVKVQILNDSDVLYILNC